MKSFRNFTKPEWALVLVTVLLVASGIGNVFLALQTGVIQTEAPTGERVVLGTMEGPADLDPQDAWDSASIDVIEQVCEGLFGYNVSGEGEPMIPVLAEDFGTFSSEFGPFDHVNYTVDLKTTYIANDFSRTKRNITFHDGSTFDAYDVKYTFDRLANLMDLHLAKAGSLYQYWDTDAPQVYNLTGYSESEIDNLNSTYGVTVENETLNTYNVFNGSSVDIINQTHVVDRDTVRFELNTAYGPFEALLTFCGSYILPEDKYPMDANINTATDDLVGTGPFDYQSFEPGVEVRMKTYNQYWRGPARFDELIFSVINDPDARNQALLAGDVDILLDPATSMYDTFNSSSDVDIYRAGNTVATQYLGMNNKNINVTFREAISYAIDYDAIINDLLDGYATRLKSPIPQGIKWSNYSLDVPTLNLTHARNVMMSMGYGEEGWSDSDWEDASFKSFGYMYNEGNEMREDMLTLLQTNLDKIGIDVVDQGTTWEEFIYTLYEIGNRKRSDLDLYWLGWLPDYDDPSNFINPLFTNRTIASNGAEVNDPQVQRWMEEALLETNSTRREYLYDEIQRRLVEEVYPWAWGYVGQNYDAHVSNLEGYPSNEIGKVYFYPCYYS